MNTAARIFASTALALASLCTAGGAYAKAVPVDDEALSNTYAGDGTTEVGKLPAESAFLNFANLLATMGGGMGVNSKTLTRDEFVAVMAEAGITSLPSSVYNGQAVSQVTLASKPTTTTMQLSQFISSMTGVKYNGPGMGTITIQNFDAGGTRLWTWNH